MMICKDCGTRNYSGTIACVKCGADLYGKRKDNRNNASSRLVRAIRNLTAVIGMAQ